jgi:hypothetical protein
MGRCVLLDPSELDRDIEPSCGSSAHAQKSLIKSPGRLKAAGAVFCICEDKDDRLGSQPKCLPIAAAMPEVGAFNTMISHAILCSGNVAASDRTE